MSDYLRLFDLEEMQLRWDVYEENPNQDFKRAAHTASAGAPPRYQRGGLSKLLKNIEGHCCLPNEGTFSCGVSSSGQLQWAIKDLNSLYAGFKRGDIQFLNECLIGPCKAYFDIDYVTADQWDMNDQFYTKFVQTVINALSHHGGFTSDLSDWIVLVCPYKDHPEPEKRKKVSIHLVYRRWRFASPAVFKKWLMDNIPSDVLTDLHIDMNVYSKSHSLRGLGHSKFFPLMEKNVVLDDRPKSYPFLMFYPPTNHNDISYELYCESLIQKVIGLDEIIVEGESQILRREAVRSDPVAQNRYISAVISLLKADGEPTGNNLDLEAYAIKIDERRNNNQVPGMSFKFKNYDGFRSCKHSCEVTVRIKLDADTFIVDCPECNPSVDYEYGLNNFSQQMIEEMRFRKFCFKHNFDRPDFPLIGTASACGKFGLSHDQFWTKLKEDAKLVSDCDCSWCNDPEMIIPVWDGDRTELPCEFHQDVRNPTILSRETFYWIQNRYPNQYEDENAPYSPEMEQYLNFFICSVGKHYYVRGEQLQLMKAVDLKECLGNLLIDRYSLAKKKKKNDPDELIVKKLPVWELWRKNRYRRDFAGVSGQRLFFGPKSQLNVLSPTENDVNECIEHYKSLDEAEKAMLRQAFLLMIDMFVYKESSDKQIQAEARHYLYRWTYANLFKFNDPKHMSILLISTESGGQGKSSFAALIGSFLGNQSGYYKAFQGNNAWGDTFNGLCNGLNLIDELVLNTAQAQILKGRMMAEDYVKRVMFKDAWMENDRCSFYLTSNKLLPGLADTGMDRRLLCLEVGSIDKMDALNLFKYECEFCVDPVVCGHSIYCHNDLMSIFKEVIGRCDPVYGVNYYRAFAGMLHEFFEIDKQNFPELWGRPNGTFCPPTEAGAELRRKCISVEFRFWIDCIRCGYHFSMKTSPPALFKGQVFFTEGMRKRFEAEQASTVKGWERVIPVKTLYQAFLWWCQQTGEKAVNLEQFLEETRIFYRTKVNRGENLIFSEQKVYCLEWKQSQLDAIKWVPVTNPEGVERCVDLRGLWRLCDAVAGVFYRQADDVAGVPHRQADRRSRLQLSRSTSNFPVAESFNQDTFYPISSQTNHSLGSQNSRENGDNFPILRQFASILNADDANQPNIYGKRLMNENFEDEEIDDSEQDALAAALDRATALKRRRLFGIDIEAEEIEEVESSSEMEEEKSISSSL